MSGPPIEVVLLRQVAGYLATPLFFVDEDGNLEYYNEPAEALLGHRYEETGQMPPSSGRRDGGAGFRAGPSDVGDWDSSATGTGRGRGCQETGAGGPGGPAGAVASPAWADGA